MDFLLEIISGSLTKITIQRIKKSIWLITNTLNKRNTIRDTIERVIELSNLILEPKTLYTIYINKGTQYWKIKSIIILWEESMSIELGKYWLIRTVRYHEKCVSKDSGPNQIKNDTGDWIMILRLSCIRINLLSNESNFSESKKKNQKDNTRNTNIKNNMKHCCKEYSLKIQEIPYQRRIRQVIKIAM